MNQIETFNKFVDERRYEIFIFRKELNYANSVFKYKDKKLNQNTLKQKG